MGHTHPLGVVAYSRDQGGKKATVSWCLVSFCLGPGDSKIVYKVRVRILHSFLGTRLAELLRLKGNRRIIILSILKLDGGLSKS